MSLMRNLRWLIFGWLVVLAGCSTPPPEEPVVSTRAARPPFFVVPGGVLLTNLNGFRAEIETTPGARLVDMRMKGELIGQGGQLLFTPSAKGKSREANASFSFVWDTTKNNGLAISEPLQGYATISSNAIITNIVFLPGALRAAEEINGRSCRQAEVVISFDDGSSVEFVLWRAEDLNGFPVRIQSKATQTTVNFFDVQQTGHVAPGLFLPPDGFTRFANAENMLAEVMARQSMRRGQRNNLGPVRQTPLEDDYRERDHRR